MLSVSKQAIYYCIIKILSDFKLLKLLKTNKTSKISSGSAHLKCRKVAVLLQLHWSLMNTFCHCVALFCRNGHFMTYHYHFLRAKKEELNWVSYLKVTVKKITSWQCGWRTKKGGRNFTKRCFEDASFWCA